LISRFANLLSPMKKPASKLTLIASLLAVACMLTVPAVQAADDAEKAAKKAKKAEADLKKYDKNANGKLDPDEEAALKADVEKQKAERKKKKDEGK
jgi:hypothetical protein